MCSCRSKLVYLFAKAREMCLIRWKRRRRRIMPEKKLFAKNDNLATYNATLRAGSESGTVAAEVSYARLTEQGDLTLHDPWKMYTVTHAFQSADWMLRPAAESTEEAAPFITAHKARWYSRTLLMTMGNETFEMFATSKLRKNFVVNRLESPTDAQPDSEGQEESHERKGVQVASLVKTSKLRGHYTVSYREDVPAELPVFCYWMANLYLKREAAGAGAGH